LIVADNEARKAQYRYHKRHGLTDRAIAAKLRISPPALWHWKNRHIPEPVKLVPTAVGNRVRLMPIGQHLDAN
jgi:transposase